MTETSFIVIHGVGNPKPGSVVRSLAQALSGREQARLQGAEEPVPWWGGEVLAGNHEFPVIRSGHRRAPELTEVNWSDLRRPLSTLAGIAKHMFSLMIALLWLGDRGPTGGSSERFRSASAYRGFVEMGLLWGMLLPPYSLLLYGLKGRPMVAVVVLGVVGLVVLVTARFQRASGFLRAGWIWAGLLTLVGIFALWDHDWACPIVEYLTRSYSLLQALGTVLLIWAAAELVLRRAPRGTTRTHRLVRLAFLYLPLLAISVVGPLLMGLASALLRLTSASASRTAEWSRVFSGELPYKVGPAEVIMGSITLVIGLLLAVPVGVSILRRSSGRRAQDWIAKWLALTPVLLVANLVLLILFALKQSPLSFPLEFVERWDAIETYRWSALRVVGFLPFFAGPLTLVLDILGDVAFDVLPETHELSVREEVRERLRCAIDFVGRDSGDLTILAHSQGSVVAADVLEADEVQDIRLLTAGSPIDSLYRRFLGAHVGKSLRTSVGANGWLNVRRPDDYVAGEIEGVADEVLETEMSGHLDYWKEPLVERAFARLSRPEEGSSERTPRPLPRP